MIVLLILQDGRTALMYASERGYQEPVKLLLALPDIEVNLKDKVRKTKLL